MNNELPQITIPPCKSGIEAFLHVRKRQGETFYRVMCKKCAGGKWAETIDRAVLAREVCNDGK